MKIYSKSKSETKTHQKRWGVRAQINRYVIVLIVFLLLSVRPVSSEEIDESEIKTKADLILNSSKFSDTGKVLKGNVEKIVGTDKSTPFIADLIDGQDVWVVKYENVKLRKQTDANLGNKKNIIIYMDTEGRFLKIVAKDIDMLENKWSLSLSDSAEGQLQIYHQKFDSLTYELPTVDFAQAIESVSGSIEVANMVIATCFYTSFEFLDSYENKLVWSIHLYGTGNPSSIERDHLRSVIDANTGEFIFGDNLPSPVNK